MMHKVVIGVGVAVAAIAGYFTFTNYSDGVRSGQVVKFSHKGSVPGCKTWEGELVLGGLRGGVATDGSGANVFRFTVSDSKVIKEIQKKLDSGDHATLTYAQPHWNLPCTTDTGYFVTSVK
jgi:hypothetical protein